MRGVVSLALVVFIGTQPAWADGTARVRAIGYLAPSLPSLYTQFANAFRVALRDVGYIEGQNLVIV